MWFLFALASAIFASFRRTSEKQLSHKLNHFTIGWTTQLAALPVLFIGLLLSEPLLNPLHLGLKFWLPTLCICIGFYPLNTYLYVNALKHGELSKILPLSSLGPVIALMLGWPFLGQTPTIAATAGILVIVAGIYVLNITDRYLHNPFKVFTADKANLYTLLGLGLVSMAGVLDKWAIDASGPMYYSFVSTAGAVITMYLAARLHGVKELASIKQHSTSLLLVGALFGLSYGSYILALSSGPLAYVTALRNSSALLIGSLIGMIILKEPATKPKVVALALILGGSLLLILG